MKVNRPGILGTRFTGSVHKIVNLVEPPLRNHEASLSAKLNQVCVDSEPYNSSGPSFTPSIVHGHDEFTKRQGLLPVAGFHYLKSKLGNRAGAMGCLPHVGSKEGQFPIRPGGGG